MLKTKIWANWETVGSQFKSKSPKIIAAIFVANWGSVKTKKVEKQLMIKMKD